MAGAAVSSLVYKGDCTMV